MEKFMMSLRAQAKQSRVRNLLPIAASLTLLAMTAVGASYAKEPSTFAPEHCEFTITFPSQPYTTRRCDEQDKNKCYNQVSYTQVFDMNATVNFRVVCSEIDQSVYDNYSAEVMEATLKAMTKRSVVETFETSYREEENYKQAGLVGEGQSGKLPTIYIAQLWIGQRSALSVEAELIGEPDEKADSLFSDILRSVHPKTDLPEQPEDEENSSTEAKQ